MKKTRTFITLLLFVIVLVSSNAVVFAANTNSYYWPDLSERKYCEYNATEKIEVYKDKSCTTRGTESPSKKYNAYIASGDKVYIYYIHSDWSRVNYPAGSSRRTGYVRTAKLLGTCVPWISYATSQRKTTTYASPGGKSIGYVEPGDTVFTLMYWPRGYVSILYTAKSGNRAYKYGWVKEAELKIK